MLFWQRWWRDWKNFQPEQQPWVAKKAPFLGLPLNNGKVEGETITCPFHGSIFDLKSGKNLGWVIGFVGLRVPAWSRHLLEMGKRPAPLTLFRVVIEDGKLAIE